jgi:hypothetical protein
MAHFACVVVAMMILRGLSIRLSDVMACSDAHVGLTAVEKTSTLRWGTSASQCASDATDVYQEFQAGINAKNLRKPIRQFKPLDPHLRTEME